MIAFFSWLVTGLVVGLIARAIMPGKQALNISVTIIIGIAGAVSGGLVSSLFWPAWSQDPTVDRMWPGWLMSIAGGIFVLWGYMALYGKRNSTYPR